MKNAVSLFLYENSGRYQPKFYSSTTTALSWKAWYCMPQFPCPVLHVSGQKTTGKAPGELFPIFAQATIKNLRPGTWILQQLSNLAALAPATRKTSEQAKLGQLIHWRGSPFRWKVIVRSVSLKSVLCLPWKTAWSYRAWCQEWVRLCLERWPCLKDMQNWKKTWGLKWVNLE